MRRWMVVAALLSLVACRPDKAAEERARLESVVLTAGQPLDCAAALGEAGLMVCASPELRALDRQAAELWAEVSTSTGRPTTWARRRTEWAADRDAGQLDPATGERRPRTDEELLALYQGVIAELTEELRAARALPGSSPATALAGGCIGAVLDGCRATGAGHVSTPSGRRLAWQIQEGSTDAAGTSAGLVLFAVEDQTLRPIGWSFEAAGFEPPVMFEHEGQVYVAARGRQAGTAAWNADLLYRLDDGAWTEIELESWKTDLAEALPEGLGVWKGVDYRWPVFEATSSLWRDGDPNCCATGGRAVIGLRVEGAALRLGEVQVLPPGD